MTEYRSKNPSKRLIIAVPLLAIGTILTQLNCDILWRYFAWSNQTLAMLALWIGATYLFRRAKNRISCLIAVIPATFMSAVVSTYILMAGAVASGGVLKTPHFLSTKGDQKVSWPDGERAISQTTVATVTDLMRTVMTEGTGRGGRIDGYDIAGKTSTGEQVDHEEDVMEKLDYGKLRKLLATILPIWLPFYVR